LFFAEKGDPNRRCQRCSWEEDKRRRINGGHFVLGGEGRRAIQMDDDVWEVRG